jgi:hypothetical protein
MKRIFIIAFLFVLITKSFATRQLPDNLDYKNLKLDLLTGWGHPSPLQVYYYQNKLKYPFESQGTNNYRGHIANWSIKDNKLFLLKILTDKGEKLVNDSSEYYWERIYKKNRPGKFNVKSKIVINKNRDGVFADWFSGVLSCVLYNSTHDEPIAHYYFLIQHGNLIDSLRVNEDDTVVNGNLYQINRNYIAFYYRMQDDEIVLNNEKCVLNTNEIFLSPIFCYYGPDFIDFPYNWQNTELSGMPHCEWLIDSNKLYLTRLLLFSGTNFDSINKKTLDLKIEFPENFKDNKVLAEYVNGVYLIKHGYEKPYGDSDKIKTFHVTLYTFVKIEAGVVVESFDVNKDIDFDKIPMQMESKGRRLIKEYFKDIK